MSTEVNTGIAIERWRSMTQFQRSEALGRFCPGDELDAALRSLLSHCNTRREMVEVFVAASYMDHHGGTPCTVDRTMALLNYLDKPGGDDAVLEPVRIASWHADGRLRRDGFTDEQQRVEMAVEILSAYAMVDIASDPA